MRLAAATHLGKVTVKDGLCVLKGVAALALAVSGNLVDSDLVVPTSDGKEVLLALAGRKRQGGDGVGGRIGEGNVRLEVAERVRCRRRAGRGSKKTRHCELFFRLEAR